MAKNQTKIIFFKFFCFPSLFYMVFSGRPYWYDIIIIADSTLYYALLFPKEMWHYPHRRFDDRTQKLSQVGQSRI